MKEKIRKSFRSQFDHVGYLVYNKTHHFLFLCMTVWRRKWQLTPVFLPWKLHGQRSLAGYSPWGYKESD